VLEQATDLGVRFLLRSPYRHLPHLHFARLRIRNIFKGHVEVVPIDVFEGFGAEPHLVVLLDGEELLVPSFGRIAATLNSCLDAKFLVETSSFLHCDGFH